MNKQIKKQIEAELLAAASEVLKRHNQSAAGKVKKILKQSSKKISKKFAKATEVKGGKAAMTAKSKGSHQKTKGKSGHLRVASRAVAASASVKANDKVGGPEESN